MSNESKGTSKAFTGVVAVIVGVIVYIVCESGVIPSV